MTVKETENNARAGIWKKQMLSCNDSDTDKIVWRESELTSRRSLIARKYEESTEGKQMTVVKQTLTGAPETTITDWDSINWKKIREDVKRLQIRIAKAVKEKRHNKVKSLQWLLSHSTSAKALAIKQVSENKGKNTPGVDKVCWRTSTQKLQAIQELKRRGYKASPLRRIYIPKRNGKLRPLSIPTMKDRAMQALHQKTIEPVTETKSDPNNFGFRPFRSTQDAMEQCFLILARKTSAKWVLEGDIQACFDTISHNWLSKNVPMDKRILQESLKSGYMEKAVVQPTTEGTPQGGIISPSLLLITLGGFVEAIKKGTDPEDKVHVVIYADDFVVTAKSKEILEDKVLPNIRKFLGVRTLKLSEAKTKITHINDGFDFLGFNLRKYNETLLIKPAKASVKHFLQEMRKCIKEAGGMTSFELIRTLNPKIRGWSNYYKHCVAKATFGKVDCEIFQAILRWINHRHQSKNWQWKRAKYFTTVGGNKWTFTATEGQKALHLARAKQVPIRRHTKIQGKANPHDPEYADYFAKRSNDRKSKPPPLGYLKG